MRSSPKERILAVERILLSRRSVTTRQILDDLERNYDIRADRKSIYDDIAALTRHLNIRLIGGGSARKYIVEVHP